jgi:hypothetical protein
MSVLPEHLYPLDMTSRRVNQNKHVDLRVYTGDRMESRPERDGGLRHPPEHARVVQGESRLSGFVFWRL